MLSDIAFYMYTKDESNYSVTINELHNFVYEYLKARNFDDFCHMELITHFIAVGILVKEKIDSDDRIRFRFNSIFNYFLTKKMQFDHNFKEYVLLEDNYLDFIDEIDYYTGLNRDQVEILELIVSRMDKEFDEIISKIESEEFSFDSFFETSSSFTSNINKATIENIKNIDKPTDEDLDSSTDELLEQIDSKKEVAKKEKATPLQKLEGVWILAGKVLKNTEEIKIKDLKLNCLNKVIKASMAFAVVYKYMLDGFLNENEDINENLKERLQLQLTFLPFLHENLLHYILGTSKLSSVIREKIENEIDDDSICDFEKFLAVFLYADIKGNDYIKYIQSFVNKSKRNFAEDFTLLKILSYYFVRSKNKNEDSAYENLIGDLHVKAQQDKKRPVATWKLQRQKIEMVNQYKKRKLMSNMSEEEKLDKAKYKC